MGILDFLTRPAGCATNLYEAELIYTDASPMPCDLPIGMVFDLKRVEDRRGPAEEEQGILVAHVHAAMTHLETKVVVPVGAVQGISARAAEEAGPGDAGQGETTTGFDFLPARHAAHVLGRHLGVDYVVPERGGSRQVAVLEPAVRHPG